MENVYTNLKKTLEICPNTNKLSYYQIMSSTKLEDDLKLESHEDALIVNYMLQVGSISRSGFSKSNIQSLKQQLGIKTFYDERELFTKVFMRDYESESKLEYKLRDDADVCDLFRTLASDELKDDLDFAHTIVSLDSKYLKAMGEFARSSFDLVNKAMDSDTSENVETFLVATKDAQKNTGLVIKYLKKKRENNGYLNISEVYETIFKKDEDGNFVDGLFKNNVQAAWLSDNNFLAMLMQVDGGFVNYITEGKISLVPPSDKPKQIVKTD